MLFAVGAIIVPPIVVFLLLWWDSRPKADANVSIGYLKTVAQGQSNVVLFVVTNRSDFPVDYVIGFQLPDGRSSDGWGPTYPDRRLPLLGRTSPMSTSIVSVASWPQGPWKVLIGGGDARFSNLDQLRQLIGLLVYRLDSKGWNFSEFIEGRKARLQAVGPKMIGDAPAPATK